MPKNKDLKRLVRDRMRRTGESYTAARQHVVRANTDRQDLAALAGMSDEAVQKKTARDWRGWVDLLDAAGATSKPHKEIAQLLREVHDVPAWWSQTITVGYERIRGLRAKGQRRGGGYDVNKSKTFAVPVATLYAAFRAKQRGRWMGDVACKVRTASRDKSMRVTWPDGTGVNFHFWPKAPRKCQLQLQHGGLPDEKAAQRVRDEWTARLTALAKVLAEADDGRSKR